MKICLLNDSFPPVIDGVVNVVVNYAKYLTENYGSEIIVGCPKYPDADYSAYPYPVVPYHSFHTEKVASGYRTGNPFGARVLARLSGFSPDLIHAHCPASAMLMARLVREQTGAPVILTYHTKYDIDIRRVLKLGPLASETIRLMVSNIEACDEVWTVSRGAGESLKKLGFEGETRVMYNGVDFEKGRVAPGDVQRVTAGNDLPPGVPVLLYVGRLMTYKGLPLILDALKIVSDAGMDFRMVFVGKGPDRLFLENKARKLGLMGDTGAKGKCLFIGPVYDRNELRAWNTRADLFLFPSTFDTNGLVVREAAACGLASVLIRDSCAAEGISDGRNGFLIDQTPQALAALLLKLAPDLKKAHQAGEHAMEELYLSWEDSVGTAYERYQEVLELKKDGSLTGRKRELSDYLLAATAGAMKRQERLNRLVRVFLHDFRESASGMMENITDAGEEIEQLYDQAIEDLRNLL